MQSSLTSRPIYEKFVKEMVFGQSYEEILGFSCIASWKFLGQESNSRNHKDIIIRLPDWDGSDLGGYPISVTYGISSNAVWASVTSSREWRGARSSPEPIQSCILHEPSSSQIRRGRVRKKGRQLMSQLSAACF